MFAYIKGNLTLTELKSAEKDYEDKLFKQFKEEMAAILHEEIKTSELQNKSELFKDLKDFRRDLSIHNVEEAKKLDKSLQKYATTSELISKFLSDFDKTKQKESVGVLKFTAIKEITTGYLEVTLHYLRFMPNFKPRRSLKL